MSFQVLNKIRLTHSIQPLIFGSAAITLALICEAILNSQNPGGKKDGLSIGGVFFIFLVTCVSCILSNGRVEMIR